LYLVLLAAAIVVFLVLCYRWRRWRIMQTSDPIIASDASVIIAFARIRRLQVLRDVFPVVQTTPTVWREVQRQMRGWRGEIQPYTARFFTGWLVVRRPRNTRLLRQISRQNPRLDRGEIEAIVLALDVQAKLLLIDEEQGRTQASALGLAIMGTLGVLKQAKHAGIIREARPFLDAMRATKFFLSQRLYERFLDSLGE
jgi:hypothetical protein